VLVSFAIEGLEDGEFDVVCAEGFALDDAAVLLLADGGGEDVLEVDGLFVSVPFEMEGLGDGKFEVTCSEEFAYDGDVVGLSVSEAVGESVVNSCFNKLGVEVGVKVGGL